MNVNGNTRSPQIKGYPVFSKIWQSLFGKRENIVTLPANDQKNADNSEQAIEDLKQRIRWDLGSGFYTSEEIVQNAADYLADDMDESLAKGEARRLLPEMIALLKLEEETWPAVTDCDRLDTAFAKLEEKGIISRQNFTCCGTCGSAEIWEEIAAARDSGGPTTGYAFYHMQDTESAVDGNGLYLNYGAVEEGERAALDIAHQIVAELEANGLKTDWDGSWNRRIAVELDWKKRMNITA